MRLILAFLVVLWTVPARAELDVAALEAKLASIATETRGGRLGVGLLDLTSGQSVFLAGDERFPMQSVFKAPLAMAVLRQVDRRTTTLDQLVTITRRDLSVPWSPIAKEFQGERRSLSVRELIRQAVAFSDNTAADVLMRLIGGPPVVQAALAESGIEGMRVDRYERELQPDVVGAVPFGPGEPIVEAEWRRTVEALPAELKRAAVDAYVHVDPRDTATPRASVEFLARLDRGQLLSPASTGVLLRAMAEAPTGAQRLRAGLPADAKFAHKTGTGPTVEGVNSATNDIGIVTFPNGTKVAVAVYLAGSTAPMAEREAIHARIAAALAEAVR